MYTVDDNRMFKMWLNTSSAETARLVAIEAIVQLRVEIT